MQANQIQIGDKVRCKIGGPDMVVGVITTQQLHGVVNNNGVLQAAIPEAYKVCTCYWWNDNTHQWNQWALPEAALEVQPN